MTKEWVIEMIFDKKKDTIQILWRQSPVFSLMSQWEVKQSKINSISTHAHVLFSISFPFLVSWIACLNASSSNHKGNWRQLAFSSVHFSSECKYLLYPFWKKKKTKKDLTSNKHNYFIRKVIQKWNNTISNDVLVQYCLTSWSSPAPRRLWRQKNFNCSPVSSFLLMYRSNPSFNIPNAQPTQLFS